MLGVGAPAQKIIHYIFVCFTRLVEFYIKENYKTPIIAFN